MYYNSLEYSSFLLHTRKLYSNVTLPIIVTQVSYYWGKPERGPHYV